MLTEEQGLFNPNHKHLHPPSLPTTTAAVVITIDMMMINHHPIPFLTKADFPSKQSQRGFKRFIKISITCL